MQTGKVGCGTAAVFGVVALILLPAACSALAEAPDTAVVPPQQVVQHDTVVIVPPVAPVPRVTVTRRVTPAPKLPARKVPRPKR